MRSLRAPSATAGLQIGSDGQLATLSAVAGGAVSGFQTHAGARCRQWFPVGGALGCQPVLPLAVCATRGLWRPERISRDQVELEYSGRDTEGRVLLRARQLITVDDWGLHLALAIENCCPVALQSPWGYVFQMATDATAILEVPRGALGATAVQRSSASPFAWPRQSTLRLPGGDALDLLAHPPLARTEVSRDAETVVLRLLSLGAIAGGQTVRGECRLRTHLGSA